MRYLYDHGLPFEKRLGLNLDSMNARVDGKKAALIIIDGGVGEGKTTLAVHVADYLGGKPIILSEQLAMGGNDFLKKLRICFQKGHRVIIYDEAGDFNRRASLTRFNAMLNRTFETYRAFKIIVILVLPNFAVLDQDIFDKKIPRLLLDCYNRSMEYGNFRAYSLYRMLYIREKMKKLVVKPLAFQFTTPNFLGHFLDLPPDRCKALDALSTAGKMKELEGAEIKLSGLLTRADMAQKLVRSVSWVDESLRHLRIKAVKKVDGRAYFPEEVVDRLVDYIDEMQPKGRPRKGAPRKKSKDELDQRNEHEIF